jgi:nicotinamide riboside transporter PnuC
VALREIESLKKNKGYLWWNQKKQPSQVVLKRMLEKDWLQVFLLSSQSLLLFLWLSFCLGSWVAFYLLW